MKDHKVDCVQQSSQIMLLQLWLTTTKELVESTLIYFHSGGKQKGGLNDGLFCAI
jgi:hypothetical protein